MSTRQGPRELTRPIPRDVRLFRRSSTRIFFFAGITVLALVLAAVLFIFPVRDYFAQNSAIAKSEKEFSALEDANEQLQSDIQRLQTPAGIRETARKELGYLLPGERRLALLELPTLSAVFPDAWPYNIVTGILAVRTAEAAKKGGSRPGTLGPLQQP